MNQLVITRGPKMCNFVDYKEYKIIYKRYASLYFITIVDKDENELIILELIHAFVEVLDKFFQNVCELDLIFNFHKVLPCASRPTSFSMKCSSPDIFRSPISPSCTRNCKRRRRFSMTRTKRRRRRSDRLKMHPHNQCRKRSSQLF